MASTEHYGLYIETDSSTPFHDWRTKLNGGEDSAIAQIDALLYEKGDMFAEVYDAEGGNRQVAFKDDLETVSGAVSVAQSSADNAQSTANSANSLAQEAIDDAAAAQKTADEAFELAETANNKGSFVIQDTEPTDTNVLWIDTGNGDIMKYYDGSSWTIVAATWG